MPITMNALCERATSLRNQLDYFEIPYSSEIDVFPYDSKGDFTLFDKNFSRIEFHCAHSTIMVFADKYTIQGDSCKYVSFAKESEAILNILREEKLAL